MYISTSQADRLRNIVANSEVAYRSYVVDLLFRQYVCLDEFKNSLQTKKTVLQSSNDPLAKKATDMLKHVNALYPKLQNVLLSLNASKVQDGNIPDLSDVIAITSIFPEVYRELFDQFHDREMYKTHVNIYLRVRTRLSHTACGLVENDEMLSTLKFVTELIELIDKRYFWYEAASEIKKTVMSLASYRQEIPVKIHNFYEVPFPEQQIVCREEEIKVIKEYIYGQLGGFRKQYSLCIFGSGGIGKTALVLEAVKEIVHDMMDHKTVNNYKAQFILFFSAKTAALNISLTSGAVREEALKDQYTTCRELKTLILDHLGVSDMSQIKKCGIIIVDNLESVVQVEREKIQNFIQVMSSQKIQYIITSRNEENYDRNFHLRGFEEASGVEFMEKYISENSLVVDLSDEDMRSLTRLSRGNTLVLVLSLRRLDKNLITLNGLERDLARQVNPDKIKNELESIPANGYELISQFMFRNTFEEIEQMFESSGDSIYAVLRVFAVTQNMTIEIDINTISVLTDLSTATVESLLFLLCKYLILEKKGEYYKLNQFAQAYIITRFLPDSSSYVELSENISKNLREVRQELDNLEQSMKNERRLKNIINDWHVSNHGDKVAIARVYKLYGEVKDQVLNRPRSMIPAVIDEAIEKINSIRLTTVHPYITFEKARILKLVSDNPDYDLDYSDVIDKCYKDTIMVIKSQQTYLPIMSTKSYSSLLWLYGIHLSNQNQYESAIRYYEDAKESFETNKIRDKDYYKCLCDLAQEYITAFHQTGKREFVYLYLAKDITGIVHRNSHLFHDERLIFRNKRIYAKIKKYV